MPKPDPAPVTSAVEGTSADGSTRSMPGEGMTKSAIESLILKNYTGLRLLILRRTRDPNVAADLLSEAICITWEKWQANQIARPDQIAWLHLPGGGQSPAQPAQEHGGATRRACRQFAARHDR